MPAGFLFACTNICIPKAEKDKQKEKLKIMSKWGKFFFDVVLDGKIFTHLNNKRKLI